MSTFRALAPSNPQNQSSSSSPSKHGGFIGESSTSGGTSGGASGANGAAGGGGGGSGGDVPRRRRIAGNVSLMACNECRHARQKCDGTKPDPCGRCLQRKLTCAYDPHTKTHKDDLIREIENLRGYNTILQDQNREMAEAAMTLEHRNKGLEEASSWQIKILDTIGNNGHDKEIIKRLRAGESHRSIANWLSQQHPVSLSMQNIPAPQRSLIDVVKRIERNYHGGALYRNSSSSIQWTKVSSSRTLLGHLLDLYFTWVHPIHMLFSEVEFMQDFLAYEDTYCSSSLVNAICAMACHLLDNEECDDIVIRDIDVATLREGFMGQARMCLTPNTYHHITSVQTFAIMYLTDLSAGKAQSAIGYLRSAVDYLKVIDGKKHSFEALELSKWGIQNLYTFCTGITYLPLHTSEIHFASFEHVRMDRNDAVWQFYRRLGDEHELPSRPSNAIMTACGQTKLFRIIQESLKLYCGTRGKITAQGIIERYRKYLEWKESLPPPIQNIDISDQPLPFVLYLHVLYHTALVQHFSPLLQSGYFAEPDVQRLRELIVSHARAGIEILAHSRRLYSSRYQLPLVTFCTLHLSDALVRQSPDDPPASETLQFCLQTMQRTRIGFAICGPLQELFRRTAVECNVELPGNIASMMEPIQDFGLDDILDACTRLSYTQPLDQVLPHIDPAIAVDWPYQWQRLIFASGGEARRPMIGERSMNISTLLND